MKIDSYSFGKIVIDGQAYTSDVIIYPDGVDSSWWRKEGHKLFPEDVRDVVKQEPDAVIIGTGYVGVMSVPRKTIEYLETQGLEVIVAKTGKAVDLFNDLQKKKSVIAALHITC